jgi:hypothetical protein
VRIPRVVTAACVFAAAALAVWAVGPARSAAAGQKGPDKAAIDRTREQVKMLDDLYKTAVVGINDTYVDKQQDVPAAMVAAQVFDVMRKKGYHDARLVDVTGKPKNDDNAAKTAFEKAAVKEILAGKTYYEEIGEKDGKPVLRAATLVPAVNKTCAACHRVKVGDKLGTIVYEVPIK